MIPCNLEIETVSGFRQSPRAPQGAGANSLNNNPCSHGIRTRRQFEGGDGNSEVRQRLREARICGHNWR